MSNRVKFFLAGAIIAAIFLFGRSCGIQSVIKNTTTDTVITFTQGDTVYVPEFIGVANTIHQTKYITKYDTLWAAGEIVTVTELVDTARILQDYYASRFYSDTQNLARGKVIISDTVNQNRIVGRRLQSFGTDTTITKTIVLRPPRKMVGYFTMSAMGNFKKPIAGAGVGFGLKLPNDQTYQVEWKAVYGQRPMGEARVMFPIRFKILPKMD
jgi:hypothetical protein